MTSILPSAPRKNTRQSFSSLPSVRKKTLGKISQLCRVSTRKHSAKFLKFTECQHQNTRQSLGTLPSAIPKTLGKQASYGQILWSLCWVSIGIHSSKPKHSAKKVPRMIENGLFAECFTLTLGNSSVWVLHSAKRPRSPFFTNLSHITDPSQFTKNHDNSQ